MVQDSRARRHRCQLLTAVGHASIAVRNRLNTSSANCAAIAKRRWPCMPVRNMGNAQRPDTGTVLSDPGRLKLA